MQKKTNSKGKHLFLRNFCLFIYDTLTHNFLAHKSWPFNRFSANIYLFESQTLHFISYHFCRNRYTVNSILNNKQTKFGIKCHQNTKSLAVRIWDSSLTVFEDLQYSMMKICLQSVFFWTFLTASCHFVRANEYEDNITFYGYSNYK